MENFFSMEAEKLACMAVKCCARECRYRNAFQMAYECNEDPPEIPEAVIPMLCTNCGNTYMHLYCFEKVKQRNLRSIKTQTRCNTMSDKETEKAMWDRKYDMIRGERQNVCICGGTLCAKTEGRVVKPIGKEQEQFTPSTKKGNRGKARYQISPRSLHFDDDVGGLDEEQQYYIWKSPYKKDTLQNEMALVSDMTASLSCVTDFPEMPRSNTLSYPIFNNVTKSNKSNNISKHFEMIPMKITDQKTFHVILLPLEYSEIWRPHIIGRQGRGLQKIKAIQKEEGNDITSIMINTCSDNAHTRIIINGKQSDHREVCAIAICERIKCILRNNVKIY